MITTMLLAVLAAVPLFFSSPVALRTDAYLTRLEGYGYSGSVLLAIDGEVVLRKGYGSARPGMPYTPDTGFEIGSMAKTFTAAAVLRLEERGALGTSESIATYLPDVPVDKRAITVEQLLSHTSGLPSGVPSKGPSPFADEVGREEVVARILELPLEFEPGREWSYSNGGYVLLAAIVERASGQSYRDFVRNEIWARAGLENTHFWGEPLRGPVAAGHDGYGNVVFDPATASATTWFDLGGGQVTSTLDDLHRWINALRSDKVLTAKQREAMFTPHTDPINANGFRFGYGWFLQQTPRGTRLALHGGDTLAAGAELTWWMDERMVLVTSTNVRHDFYPTRNRVDRVLRPMFFGDRAEPDVPTFVRADVPPPPGMIGTYGLPSGGTLHLTELHGRLYLGATGQNAVALLSPAAAEAQKERAWRSKAVRDAVDQLMNGRPASFDVLAGSTETHHLFRDAVREEIAALGRGIPSVETIGSFAAGYPVGNTPVGETTLLRLRFENAEAMYVIRWNERRIVATEVANIPYAAMMPLQQLPDATWAGWNIVTEKKVVVEVLPDGAIRVRSDGTSAVARRI
jgi:CubicO group peptidase (beta-lactamase class C family)